MRKDLIKRALAVIGTERNRQTVAYASAFSLLAGKAFAQAGGDVLGVTPVEQAFIAFLEIVAVIGVGWGFAMLMTGRHRIEALFALGVGVLGITKAQAIVTFLGG